MKIAIDTYPLESGHASRGMGFYVRQLVKALMEESKKSDNVKIETFNFRKSGQNLPKYDVVHIPYFDLFFNTLKVNENIKTVVTVADVIPLIYPDKYPSGIRGSLSLIKQKRELKKANYIITISETSKKDIVRFLGITEEKIKVTYLAPGNTFIKQSDSVLEKVRKKYDLPKEYVLYVGDVNWNKNIINLIKACKLAHIALVIVGKQAKEMDMESSLEAVRGPRDWLRYVKGEAHPEEKHYRKLLSLFEDKNVYRLGYIDDSDIGPVYQMANCYCQPSFYEGFGLPLLEAFKAGVPVLASKTQALVEIGGEAAIYFDPYSVKDMAAKIRKLIKDKGMQISLTKKGKQRLADFSWEKVARETIKVYKDTSRGRI